MLTLGMDTSGKTLSVALAKDRTILAEYSLALGYQHSVTFQPLVQEILQRTGFQLPDIGLFALATGPGSFTGIRIGLASVKAMAYAVGARTVGISSLRALAESAGPFPGLTLPVLDARGGRVYSSLYRAGEELISEGPRSIPDLLLALAAAARPDEPVLVTGDGLPLLQESDPGPDLLATQLVFAPPHLRYIRASAVIGLALEDLAGGGQATDPFDLEARYLLSSSAERARGEEDA